MSRLKFARSMGAEPNNPYNAWSYINHLERFVLFGAWVDEERSDYQLIFSKEWKVNGKGNKPASYQPSLRHLEHVIEDGYELRTFRQYAKPSDGTGIPKIDRFDWEWEARELLVVGSEFRAVRSTETAADAGTIEPDSYFEGAKFQVLQTHYERSPDARRACLKHYLPKCQVCEFDFEAEFGDIGAGFIHVHHLVPVSERKSTYKVDPIADLRPVCPNCHAMIHKRNPPYSIEEIKSIRTKLKHP